MRLVELRSKHELVLGPAGTFRRKSAGVAATETAGTLRYCGRRGQLVTGRYQQPRVIINVDRRSAA